MFLLSPDLPKFSASMSFKKNMTTYEVIDCSFDLFNVNIISIHDLFDYTLVFNQNIYPYMYVCIIRFKVLYFLSSNCKNESIK